MGNTKTRLPFKLFVLGILLGGLWFFYNIRAFSQDAVTLRVVVAEQPGSPLLILLTHIDSSDPLKPRYGYTATNSSDKPIRAYTIQEAVSLDGGTRIISTGLVHSPVAKLFLKPHDSRLEEGGIDKTYKSPPVQVELAVDFIEFADGTRWGDDASKSGETLDGTRAGGKAAINRYREVLAKEGTDGLERALEAQDSPTPQNPKSAEWQRGFSSGSNSIRRRLREARAKGGQNELKRELDKPFDSTEGRQEP